MLKLIKVTAVTAIEVMSAVNW